MRILALKPTCNQTRYNMITKYALTTGIDLTGAILDKMDRISKWHKSFFCEVIVLFLTIKGKINFLQMERYSNSCEVRYRNMFAKKFKFNKFNHAFINEHCSDELIIGFDPSYLPKSGKHTKDVGYFYSGVAGCTKRGIEIGCIAIIDVKQNTAYHYEAEQTPKLDKGNKEENLVDHYCKLITTKAVDLKGLSSILVADAWFNKKKFVDGVTKTGFEFISRLRTDANLLYLYDGLKKTGRGRPIKYDGKVKIKAINTDKITKVYEDEQMIIYSGIVYSVSLKRNIKIAYTQYLNTDGQVKETIIYYSTNLQRSGEKIVEYYKARFQMEFIFRDGKQHTGLADCQARSEEKIYNHVNYSMTAVNLAKGIIRQGLAKDEVKSCSIQDIKTELFNQYLLERIFCNFAISTELKKNDQLIRKILDIGKVAA
jgi:hypothetical protein